MINTNVLRLWMRNKPTMGNVVIGIFLTLWGLSLGLLAIPSSPIVMVLGFLVASFGSGMLVASYNTQKIAFSRPDFLKDLLEKGYVGVPTPDGSLVFASTFFLEDTRATEMRVVIGTRDIKNGEGLAYVVGTYENLKDWMWRVEVKSSSNIEVWGLHTPVWKVLKQLVTWWPLLSPSTVTDSGDLGELLEKNIVEKAGVPVR